MPLGCVPLTDAAWIATTASGFRQSTLHHDLGGAKQLAKKLVLTHENMLGQSLRQNQVESDIPASRTGANLHQSGVPLFIFAPQSS
jgi:hypothetical protein